MVKNSADKVVVKIRLEMNSQASDSLLELHRELERLFDNSAEFGVVFQNWDELEFLKFGGNRAEGVGLGLGFGREEEKVCALPGYWGFKVYRLSL